MAPKHQKSQSLLIVQDSKKLINQRVMECLRYPGDKLKADIF